MTGVQTCALPICYSSLSYLRHLPLDSLKIDQSFVREMPSNQADSAIALATITVAHSLGLRVTAEGVENAAQHDLLRGHRCDTGQGYLYSRPVVAETATRLLGERGGSIYDSLYAQILPGN